MANEELSYGKGIKSWLTRPRIREAIRDVIVDTPRTAESPQFLDHTRSAITHDPNRREITLGGDITQHPEYWIKSLLACKEHVFPLNNTTDLLSAPVLTSTETDRGVQLRSDNVVLTVAQATDLLDQSLGLYEVDKEWFLAEVNEAWSIRQTMLLNGGLEKERIKPPTFITHLAGSIS